jgi:predicted Zn-dependent protease
LAGGLENFADERFRQAASSLRRAKDLAPRAATVRELLGLSYYQLEQWKDALAELKTFRRMTGETTHMAVEMDCLRALGRPGDVEKTWDNFEELGGERDTEDELRVVYASHLMDLGRISEAWRVIKPGRLIANPPEAMVRRWAVAARVAHEAGDDGAARTLYDNIKKNAGSVPWLDDLASQLGF